MRGLGGAGDVPVFGMPASLSPRDAAIVNGFLIHGLDYDDTHIAGVLHPTASVLPAVTAFVAEKGWKVDELRLEQGRLDDVFRELTAAGDGAAGIAAEAAQ